MCLDCTDGDFCADCYASWKKSNGEMECCKGHIFYEIPRPCWFQFEKGSSWRMNQSCLRLSISDI